MSMPDEMEYVEVLIQFLTGEGRDANYEDVYLQGHGYYGHGYMFEWKGTTFHVLDEWDREAASHEALENYIDECVLNQIPKTLRFYFDTAKFIQDALITDGYGHTLNSSYDGREYEHQSPERDEWFYIYPEGAF